VPGCASRRGNRPKMLDQTKDFQVHTGDEGGWNSTNDEEGVGRGLLFINQRRRPCGSVALEVAARGSPIRPLGSPTTRLKFPIHLHPLKPCAGMVIRRNLRHQFIDAAAFNRAGDLIRAIARAVRVHQAPRGVVQPLLVRPLPECPTIDRG